MKARDPRTRIGRHLARPDFRPALGSGLIEHGFEIRRIEATELLLGKTRKRLCKATDRVVGALGMRVVAREHEELRARRPDECAHVLAGKWGELELTADVLRRPTGERSDGWIALREEGCAAIEPLEEVGHPAGAQLDGAAAQLREPLEDTVEYQGRKKHLRSEADH